MKNVNDMTTTRKTYVKPDMTVTEFKQNMMCASLGDGGDDSEITFPIPDPDDPPFTGEFD